MRCLTCSMELTEHTSLGITLVECRNSACPDRYKTLEKERYSRELLDQIQERKDDVPYTAQFDEEKRRRLAEIMARMNGKIG